MKKKNKNIFFNIIFSLLLIIIINNLYQLRHFSIQTTIENYIFILSAVLTLIGFLILFNIFKIREI